MMRFWGKLKRASGDGEEQQLLPLTNHCIDVAMVFRELCELPALGRALNQAAGTKLTPRQLDRLAVFAFFHDLGKCNWGFQAKKDPEARITAGHVRETLPLFFHETLAPKFYRIFRFDALSNWVDGEEALFRMFLAAISHHGRPAFTLEEGSSLECRAAVKFWRPADTLDPLTGLDELFQTARAAFPSAFEDGDKPIPVTPTLQHRFAGLLMLADWLGSHSEAFFTFQHEGNRFEWSKVRAKNALSLIGLNAKKFAETLNGRSLTFDTIFGFSPYPLQAKMCNPDQPPLLIAESETGSGKTEAALIYFLALFAAGQVDGLYFALPTRVAAQEMYRRVLMTMRQAFGDDFPPVLLAVPGYAHIDGEPYYALPSEDRLFCEAGHRHERRWVAERPKRFLAATVAIGTIDQALLSALRVGHAHLRRICLDRSLLVIDEVHSSDVYMRALSLRMIEEHLKVGGRVLLLSATLGAGAREEYLNLKAMGDCPDFHVASSLPYPSLTGIGFGPEGIGDPKPKNKTVRLEAVHNMERMRSLIPSLEKAVSQGMRVLVVLNTVRRAIALFRLADEAPVLRNALFHLNGVTCPHHGRFARVDR